MTTETVYKLCYILYALNFFTLIKALGIEELVHGDYDKNRRPFDGIHPVNVTNHVILASLGPLNEQDMTFTVSFYHRQWWNDPRLVINGTLKEITSNVDPKRHIWIPDIYVVNAQEVNYSELFTRTIIQTNGDVYFSRKVDAKCTCRMNLRKYPMDEQQCPLQLESYAFNNKHLHLRWHTKWTVSFPADSSISLTGYDLLSISSSTKEIAYSGDENTFIDIFLHFLVRRTSVYYVYKAFIPTVLLSIFNLCSYWIPETAMPARITLIITTFLANMLILQSVSDQTIKVSYTTAMQLFLLINLMFLMTSILQYLCILYMSSRSALKRYKNQQESRSIVPNNFTTTVDKEHRTASFMEKIQNTDTVADKINTNNDDLNDALKVSTLKIMEQTFFDYRGEHRVHILDRIFRIAIPIIYILFCSVFFVFYYTDDQ